MTAPLKREEKLQTAFLITVTAFLVLIFFFTPALRPATLFTILNVIILGPAVRWMEKRKIPRLAGILVLYTALGLFLIFGVSRLIHVLSEQWAGLIESLPALGNAVQAKLDILEDRVHDSVGIEVNLGFKKWISTLGPAAKEWAIENLPAVVGNLASAAVLVPIFSFFILKDGRKFSGFYLKLFPHRFSSSAAGVLNKILRALGRFVRAKILEALLFAILIYIGLRVMDAPYAGIFSLIAGIANIIPYLGPFLGAAPPLLLFGFSDANPSVFWPAFFLFLGVNALDMILIFPVLVGKIVNLTPLTLLASVAVGQELYGIAGMLLAVPVASVLKIIYLELQALIYP